MSKSNTLASELVLIAESRQRLSGTNRKIDRFMYHDARSLVRLWPKLVKLGLIGDEREKFLRVNSISEAILKAGCEKYDDFP